MVIGIGSGSSYKAIVIAKFIKKNYPDILTLGFDKSKFINTFHSRYYDYVIYDEQFLTPQGYLALMTRNKIDIMIPVDSSEYKMIYSSPELLKIRQLSYLGCKESFESLNNKKLLHNLALGLGINVPRSFYNDRSKIRPGTVVKPLELTSSKGVMYVRNNQDVPLVSGKVLAYGDFIVQENIYGAGVGLSLFAEKGEIFVQYGHKRLAEYPITGGSSAYRTSFNNEEMLKVAGKIVKDTNWSGFAMFEFKLTPDNKIYLIEVNPRVWGSINQGLENGVNYFESLLGKVPLVKPQKQVNTYISPIIYLSLARYFLKSRFTPLWLFLKNIFRNKSDVNIFKDPGGYLSLLLRKIS